MTPSTSPSSSPILADRLRQRLESLGVTVGVLSDDGRLTLVGPSRWVERLIVTSRPFVASARQRVAELRQHSGGAVALWPGLWLVAMPAVRRRRAVAQSSGEPLPVALILGHELIYSDQFRAVCDAQQIDAGATVARIDESSLVSAAEAQRLASTLLWMLTDSLEIDRRLGELQSLSQQLGESYEELSLLYKLSTSMTVNQPPATFLTDSLSELREVLGLRWMALQLIDDEPLLNDLAGHLFIEGPIGGDGPALHRVGRLILAQHAGSTKPTVVDDTAKLNNPELTAVATHLLIVPLTREGRSFGVLFGGDKLDGSDISSVDSKLCSSLANSLAIFLENTMLYEDMHSMFLGTLHALTASIDAKDSYTHGHSERVALLSRELARAFGLDDHTVERVYISALVHDVGKIGVPEAVLCKPGKLTDEEFALIKLHPEIGGRILQDIRQMQDLIPGVLHHHERWDGRGYPHRLTGEDIPLFGRLICLADSFDAMSSNRTYRQALPLEKVLAEVTRCAGTQFDPALAEVFVKLDFTPFFALLEQHMRQMRKETPR